MRNQEIFGFNLILASSKYTIYSEKKSRNNPEHSEKK
jgi:hypothetical protein